MSKEEFRAWLQEIDITYEELTQDKKVEYKAIFDGIRIKGNLVAINISFRKEFMQRYPYLSNSISHHSFIQQLFDYLRICLKYLTT